MTVDFEDEEVRRTLMQYKGLWIVYQPVVPKWYTGSGAPSDDLGMDGDFYLDKDTTNIYLKESGTWG